MRLRSSLISGLLVLAFALVGCGGGNGDGVTVEGSDDFSFSPATLTIDADSDVSVTFENVGDVPHDWTVEELGIQLSAAGGESETSTINAPAGTYEVICTIPGHADAGMTGTLVVE